MANKNAGKGGHCKENWVIETGGPMSYKRNGFLMVLRKICQTKMETRSCEYGFIF